MALPKMRANHLFTEVRRTGVLRSLKDFKT
jgi:hypothetical protein